MKTGRLLSTIFGALLALLGLAGLAAGVALLVANGTQRDADGFFTSPTYDVSSSGYGITTEDMALAADPGDWFPGEGDLVFRFEVTAAGSDVFVGIADADELRAYLATVEHDRITHVGERADSVRLERESGGAPAGSPAAESIWVASTEGGGTQVLTWDALPGTWALAIMNADGSAGLDLQMAGAVWSDLVVPIAIGALVVGIVLFTIGAALIIVGVARPTEGAVASDEPTVVSTASGPYPLRLVGQLDPQISRWRWLVKWLLALPHVLVLAFLWVAFVVLTLVAGIAILFTGRYPRSIFDVNVGVLRWTWRVTFYAFGVLGTDRYPPFSLASDPTFPADLDVVYPEQLSRGLVLVKWWLLAIPHYLVVGFLTGGMVAWTLDLGGPGGSQGVLGGGLIGLLAFVAGGVLLVTGRYATGLFDLLMGLQRWVHRVVAYAALMTDEYPPFRLDAGGSEPPVGPSGPLPGPPTPEGEARELAHH